MDEVLESYYGRTIGHFTLQKAASNGGHPEEVRGAWVGIALPVRELYEPERWMDTIRVLCADGFNALVEAGVQESVRKYWIDSLGGVVDSAENIAFKRSDGTYVEAAKE